MNRLFLLLPPFSNLPDLLIEVWRCSDSCFIVHTWVLGGKSEPVGCLTILAYGHGESQKLKWRLGNGLLLSTYFRTTNSISSKQGLTRAASPEPRHRTRGEWGLALIKEARTTNRKPLLLTRRVYFSVDFFLTSKRKYPVASIIKNLDWVNVMCFDYHGGWDTLATGTHAWLRVLTALVETAAFFPATVLLKAG